MKIEKLLNKITILGTTTLLLIIGSNIVSATNNRDNTNTLSNVEVNENINTEVNENINTELTKEQALEELLKYNSKVDYDFMGTEQDFECLQEKELQGYVYLPKEVNTDLGYFVDKNTKEIYKFHPSGWVERI